MTMMAAAVVGTPQLGIASKISSSSDDESESSPEPSPVGPPPPQPQRQQQAPWTPPQQQANVDTESCILSLPKVPSPYSPPPASLFSGEEFPPKTVRKNGRRPPFSEIRLQHQHLQQLPSPYGQPSPAPSHSVDRSVLLPTVINLKKDLEESHQNMFLLQQENKALAAECDRFHVEMSQWQQQAEAAHQKTERKAATLQQQVNELTTNNGELVKARDQLDRKLAEIESEKDALTGALTTTKALLCGQEKKNEDVVAELESLQQEIRGLRLKLKDQSADHAKKLKEVQEEASAEREVLEKENAHSMLELDRCRAMLCEAKHQHAKELSDVDTAVGEWTAEVQRLETALAEAKAQNEELQADNESWQLAAANREAAKRDEIDRLLIELEESKAAKEQADTENEQWKKKLETAVTDAQKERESARKELEKLKTALEQANGITREVELRTQEAAKNAEFHREKVVDDLKTALEQSNAKKNELLAEKDVLSKKFTKTKARLLEEVELLQGELLRKNEKLCALRGTPKRRAVPAKNVDIQANEMLDETEQHLNGGERVISHGASSVAERLHRIRDAAERAALVQGHTKEMACLKMEYEAEIKQLREGHERALKDVLQETNSQINLRAKDYKRRLQAEYDAKIVDLERQHKAELRQARRESEKNASVVDEVMQAAASEVSSLEAKVDELESQLSSERKKNERGLDRKKWKNETNSLLSSIQQECNSIFRNKMMPVQSSPSPRTVVDEDDDNEVDLSVVALDQTQDHVLRTMVDWSPVTSAAAVDVDQTLDETEAIVRSLMEGA